MRLTHQLRVVLAATAIAVTTLVVTFGSVLADSSPIPFPK